MFWRKMGLTVAAISIIAAAVLPSEAADRRPLRTYDAGKPAIEPDAPAPGYFGIFEPNAYDYEPHGYGPVPPFGYGFPPYGFGCLQRTVVLTLFGPRVRQVWVCG
jgi:hypothetical protein